MIIEKAFLFLILGVQLHMPRLSPMPQDTGAHQVTVVIHDLRPKDGGELWVAFLNSTGQKVLSAKVIVSATKAQVVFRQVPTGTFAVRYFHDANANGKLDTGWFNIPDEGVGCSNDAKGFMSAPDLKDMLFAVDRSMTIESHINYY